MNEFNHPSRAAKEPQLEDGQKVWTRSIYRYRKDGHYVELRGHDAVSVARDDIRTEEP